MQVPLIARAAGDRGLISQLLGPKYGAFFVCGSLGGKSTPGLPALTSIKDVYKLEYVNTDTRVFGVISNPVGHSKGPLLHNPAFRHTGYNGIYVPLLVDNIKEFFRVFSCNDYAGFRYAPYVQAKIVMCCIMMNNCQIVLGMSKDSYSSSINLCHMYIILMPIALHPLLKFWLCFNLVCCTFE